MSKSLVLHYGVTVFIKGRAIQVKTKASSGAQAARFLSNQLHKLTGLSYGDCLSYIEMGTRVQLSMVLNKLDLFEVIGRWSTDNKVTDAIAPISAPEELAKSQVHVAEQLELFSSPVENKEEHVYVDDAVVWYCPACSKVMDEGDTCPDCNAIMVSKVYA